MDQSLNGRNRLRRPQDINGRLDELARVRDSLYRSSESEVPRRGKRRKPEYGHDANGKVYSSRRFREAESLFRDCLPDGCGYRRV